VKAKKRKQGRRRSRRVTVMGIQIWMREEVGGVGGGGHTKEGGWQGGVVRTR